MSRWSPQATVEGVLVGLARSEAEAAILNRARDDPRFIDIVVAGAEIRFADSPLSPFVSKSQYSVVLNEIDGGTNLTVTVESTGIAVGDVFGFYQRKAEEFLKSLSVVPVSNVDGVTGATDRGPVHLGQMAGEYVFISLVVAALGWLIPATPLGLAGGLIAFAIVIAVVSLKRRHARTRSRSSGSSFGPS
jgi:hypothetical protein